MELLVSGGIAKNYVLMRRSRGNIQHLTLSKRPAVMLQFFCPFISGDIVNTQFQALAWVQLTFHVQFPRRRCRLCHRARER